jgi:hypothetical protein
MYTLDDPTFNQCPLHACMGRERNPSVTRAQTGCDGPSIDQDVLGPGQISGPRADPPSSIVTDSKPVTGHTTKRVRVEYYGASNQHIL